MDTSYEKRVAATLVDNQQIMERAEKLLDGEPLLFTEDEMSAALEAFIDFKKISYKFFGDAHDFLQKIPIHTMFGRPYCRACGEKYFSSERKYANHMMSIEHFLTSFRTTLAAVNEVRAHLQANPIDANLMTADYFQNVAEAYRFRGLPSGTE